MDKYTATELAFKHGYEKGYEAGKPKWIPVTERLPEKRGRYLVVTQIKYVWQSEYRYFTDIAEYDPYGDGYIDGCWDIPDDWDDDIHVSHWMPLPEPPKED
jgi:hypothetical protein